MDREPSPPVTMSDPAASDPVTSNPAISGQFVTRDEFSRLEARLDSRFDEMLQLMRGQTEPSAPTSISSHGSGLDVSETLEQLKARSPAIAAVFNKDTKQGDKTGETDDIPQTYAKELANSGTASVFNVTDEDTERKTLFSQTMADQVKQLSQNMKELENRLCVRPNISMQQIMSEFQTEMREILTTARSSQEELQTTVKQQTRNLEDIHDMTGHLSNQLNTVIEETKTISQCTEEVRQSNTVLIQDIQKSTETITQKADISSENLTKQSQKSASSLHDKIDQSTNDVTTKLNSSLHTLSGEVVAEMQKVGETVEDTKRSFESHDQRLDGFIDGIHKAVENHGETMKKNIDGVRKIVADHDVKIVKNTAEIQRTVKSLGETVKMNIDGIQKAVESHDVKIVKHTAEIQQTITSNGETMRKNIDGIQKTVESHGVKMKSLKDSLTKQNQNTRTHVDTKMTENTKQLKDNMYKLKLEIFSFTEKECQIVRDRIEGPLPPHKVYTLDFYVEDFRHLIKSGVERYSPPWHINHFKSSIQGWVQFLNNGKLRVRIFSGRHPLEVGLQTRQSGSLQIKATISDTSGKLPDMEVGEETGNFNEDGVKSNTNWGHDLGDIDCQSILDAGYADKPGYINGAVLVRYLVEVL